MKKTYYKEIDSQVVFFKEPLITNDMQVWNPSEELILAEGWQEYIPEPYVPILEDIKANKIEEIKSYDSSDAVNEFVVMDNPMWVEAPLRAQLRISIEAYKGLGIDSITKIYNGLSYTFSTSDWDRMLNMVEVYASECFNVTQLHISNVQSLTSIQEVENYDNTTGYPEKLNFEI